MKSNGLATILLIIPVLTVPALAIFGIPQFAPVVASPIDDGPNFDRGPRTSSSTGSARDDVFDEVEGLSSESELKPGSMTPLRNRGMSKNLRRENGPQRPESGSAPSWNGDLENGSSWPNSQRQSFSKGADTMSTRESLFNGDDSNSAANQNGLPRFQRRLPPADKTNAEIRQAKIDDPDQGVTQSGFTDGAYIPERPPVSVEEKRKRSGEFPGSSSRTKESEPLTWAAAVERLNEFDIRSFRLEPGERSGQFLFICSYTSPDAPTVSYRFEAGADEPLKAVEKVLEQIVEWRRTR